jgi:hypothetical protein
MRTHTRACMHSQGAVGAGARSGGGAAGPPRRNTPHNPSVALGRGLAARRMDQTAASRTPPLPLPLCSHLWCGAQRKRVAQRGRHDGGGRRPQQPTHDAPQALDKHGHHHRYNTSQQAGQQRREQHPRPLRRHDQGLGRLSPLPTHPRGAARVVGEGGLHETLPRRKFLPQLSRFTSSKLSRPNHTQHTPRPRPPKTHSGTGGPIPHRSRTEDYALALVAAGGAAAGTSSPSSTTAWAPCEDIPKVTVLPLLTAAPSDVAMAAAAAASGAALGATARQAHAPHKRPARPPS